MSSRSTVPPPPPAFPSAPVMPSECHLLGGGTSYHLNSVLSLIYQLTTRRSLQPAKQTLTHPSMYSSSVRYLNTHSPTGSLNYPSLLIVCTLLDSSIHPPTHPSTSCIYLPPTNPSIHPHTLSFDHPCTHTYSVAFIHSSIHPPIRYSIPQASTHSFIHLPSYPPTHPLTHPPTYPLIQPPIDIHIFYYILPSTHQPTHTFHLSPNPPIYLYTCSPTQSSACPPLSHSFIHPCTHKSVSSSPT